MAILTSDGSALFAANFTKPEARAFTSRKGVETTRFETAVTGLPGTGKAEGRNIAVQVAAADLRQLAEMADKAGHTVVRITVWARTPRDKG